LKSWIRIKEFTGFSEFNVTSFKMKSILSISILLIFTTDPTWNRLDLGPFSLQVPKNWRHKEEQGIDSFVGSIVGPRVKLFFDYSKMGYANPLIKTPEEYAMDASSGFFYVFMKPGVIYTTGDVDALRREEMKKVNVTDTSKILVEKTIIPTTKIYKPSERSENMYKEADFIVELTHQDSTVTMPMTIPEEIKKYNIRIDTTDRYIIKTIWPKKAGDGMTGVYYKSINSSFNMQIHGTNLSSKDQENALKAFKTIEISE
jgi:hypothetical protein